METNDIKELESIFNTNEIKFYTDDNWTYRVDHFNGVYFVYRCHWDANRMISIISDTNDHKAALVQALKKE